MELRVKPTSFGEAVKRERDERHLTQAEVASTLGVSTRTVQNWEAGAVPRATHRRAIIAWLSEKEAA